jgi:hypothetical protein
LKATIVGVNDLASHVTPQFGVVDGGRLEMPQLPRPALGWARWHARSYERRQQNGAQESRTVQRERIRRHKRQQFSRALPRSGKHRGFDVETSLAMRTEMERKKQDGNLSRGPSFPSRFGYWTTSSSLLLFSSWLPC